jgi:Gp49-like protein DUF891
VIVILKACRREIATFPEEIRDALVRRDAVHVLHAFKKTTQATPAKNLALAKTRQKEVLS